MKKMLFSAFAFMLLFSFSNSFGMDNKSGKKELRILQRLHRDGKFDATAASKAMKLERDATENGLSQIAVAARSLHKRNSKR